MNAEPERHRDDQRPTEPMAALLHDVCLTMQARSERNHPYSHFCSANMAAFVRLRETTPAIDAYCQTIVQGLTDEIESPLDVDRVAAIRSAYAAASDLVFPVSKSFLDWCRSTNRLTYTHSLRSICLETLRELEVRGHQDATLRQLLRDFRDRLDKITGVEDHNGFGQAFECFSEAVVYAYLKDRLTSVSKIDEKGGKQGSTPDFECTLDDLTFFIEVKTFDVVDGVYRASEMMDDGVKVNIDLEAQLKSGRRIAMAEQEIAPYKKANDKGVYDPRSLHIVIETFKEKARKAFKSSQFALGPTFAFASMARLGLVGGAQSVMPYYVLEHHGFREVVAGELWQACFGRRGGVVLGPHDSIYGSVQGHLETDGLYCDEHQPLPGIGLVVMEHARGNPPCYGLCNVQQVLDAYGWDPDDVKNVLGALCVSYNDGANREASVSMDV